MNINMKNPSLILSIVSLVIALVFGILFLTADKSCKTVVTAAQTDVKCSDSACLTTDSNKATTDSTGVIADSTGVIADSTGVIAESAMSQLNIAYINLDYIIAEYDMANDLRSVVGSRLQKINDEITKKGKKLEKDVKKFQEDIEKGVLLPSVAKKKQEELVKAEKEFNKFAATKQQEMQQEELVMMNQIADAIKTFIDQYNEEKQYSMILTNNGGTPVITALPSFDITEDVLAKLNEAYTANKK